MTGDAAYIFVWALLWVLLLAVCAFAFSRGGEPERWGAGLILAITVASALGDALLPQGIFLVARLLAEGALALGFLFVAIRYASLWLGGVMLLQAVQFSLQAYYFVTHRAHDATYVVINNIDFFGILACLTAGTLASSRRRRAFAAQAAE
ncbi:MAG: hypothetical protein A2882_03095 [Phenylobacterium sp. RIFCSPHIGHO2_01_FULL_70_10]|nr:MAG: hypothetical protein A2882_03095 [Phenylobacterium sp. RIFCSPHIGHO2_01_FULL_70_10]